MTDYIGTVYAEMRLNCPYRSDQVPTMTKTRQDNYIINRTDAVYIENEIKLS